MLAVVRLARAAAARSGELGVNERECKEVRLHGGALTQPRRRRVDGEAQFAEEPRLPIIEAREWMCRGRRAVVRDDEQ